MKDYDTASENYDIIRKILKEKYDKSSTVKKSLYNELHSLKRKDRKWKGINETMERISRQLDITDTNLQRSSAEIIIESKLLHRYYIKYTKRENLRQFLMKLVQRNNEVTKYQTLRGEKMLKPKRASYGNKRETSETV